jgi:Raf kinase inhibitor-like YbhB/YbcL family protein
VFPFRRAAVAGSLLAVLALCACAPAAEQREFELSSPEIDADGYLPDSARGNVEAYCGDGDNVSPTLQWVNAPEGTESYVLLMTDPSYPSYDHWVVTAIPGDVTSIAAAADGAIDVGVVGTNSRGAGDYVGPCQPDSAYLYTLYALDTTIDGDPSITLDDAVELIDGHVLAEASLEAMRR